MALSRRDLMAFWTPENRDAYKSVYKEIGSSEKSCFKVEYKGNRKQVVMDADCIKGTMEANADKIKSLWS
jgi:hypothetical protein